MEKKIYIQYTGLEFNNEIYFNFFNDFINQFDLANSDSKSNNNNNNNNKYLFEFRISLNFVSILFFFCKHLKKFIFFFRLIFF